MGRERGFYVLNLDQRDGGPTFPGSRLGCTGGRRVVQHPCFLDCVDLACVSAHRRSGLASISADPHTGWAVVPAPSKIMCGVGE